MKRLVLPIPPTVNHAYKAGRHGRRIQTDATKQFKHDAYWLAYGWRQYTGWTMPEKGVKIQLKYWVFWPDNRRRDVDNLAKVLQDSLTDVLYVDDRYVLPQAMDYTVDRENPRLEIELSVKEE